MTVNTDFRTHLVNNNKKHTVMTTFDFNDLEVRVKSAYYYNESARPNKNIDGTIMTWGGFAKMCKKTAQMFNADVFTETHIRGKYGIIIEGSDNVGTVVEFEIELLLNVDTETVDTELWES